MSTVLNQTPPRVSVSRKRTVNLGRFNLPYESEEIFITLSIDCPNGYETNLATLLDQTETALDKEVQAIEKHYAMVGPKAKIKGN